MNTDKKQIKPHIGSIEDKQTRKELFQAAKAAAAKGEKTGHTQADQLARNLHTIPINTRPPEEQLKIRRKAAAATNRIKGEKKTAKQILDNILPLYANKDGIKANENIPEDLKQLILSKNIQVTQYDLLYMSMLYQAQNGNYKAAEFIRDTAGDKPTEKIHNINETISEADRRLIEKLNNRIIGGESES